MCAVLCCAVLCAKPSLPPFTLLSVGRSATVNYGRKGLPVQAISAVDLAIWDLLGKIRKEPVYALLGGKTKDRLPVYMYARPQRHNGCSSWANAKMPLAFALPFLFFVLNLVSAGCLSTTLSLYSLPSTINNRTSSRPDCAKELG